MNDFDIDFYSLPEDIRVKIFELEIELSEGDITQKGFDKKKTKILESYAALATQAADYKGFEKNQKASPEKLTDQKPIFRPNTGFISSTDEDGEIGCEGRTDQVTAITMRLKLSDHDGTYERPISIVDREKSPQNERKLTKNSDKARMIRLPHRKTPRSSKQLFKNANGVHGSPGSMPQEVDRENATRSHAQAFNKITRNESRYTSDTRQEAVDRALKSGESQLPSVLAPHRRKTSRLSSINAFAAELAPNGHSSPNTKTSDDSSIPAKITDSELSSSLSRTNTENSGNSSHATYDLKHCYYYNDTKEKAGMVTKLANSRDDTANVNLPKYYFDHQTEGGAPNPPPLSKIPGISPETLNDFSRHPERSTSSEIDGRSYSININQDSLVGPPENGHPAHPENDTSHPGRVSNKIQQLLNTLKKPRQRLLDEFFKDEDSELEDYQRSSETDYPKAEGSVISPTIGQPLTPQIGKPKSLEEALIRYGAATPKCPAFMVLDPNTRAYNTLTYGKFLRRAHKISYCLLNKWRSQGQIYLKPGDRVALVYPNTNPVSFACAFYGCLLSGFVPVPVDVPFSKRDACFQQIGFSLSSCNACLALTSDACLKALPKIFGEAERKANRGQSTSAPPQFRESPLGNLTPVQSPDPMCHNGTSGEGNNHKTTTFSAKNVSEGGLEIKGYKSWPTVTWFSAERIPCKPPKGWQPPGHNEMYHNDIERNGHIGEDDVAYIEHSTSVDRSVKGVCVTKSAMLNHCKALTMACNYKQGEIMVCVLDFKKDVGLWHAILTSVYNGMHVIFIPYSLMKVNPAIWMHMITKFKASAAIVKSRDLHWGLLAHKDHKDINLSSLNVLIVADGSNPWSLSSADAFYQAFKNKGLRHEAICPCSGSPESLTLSVKRPIPTIPNPACNSSLDNSIDLSPSLEEEHAERIHNRITLSMSHLSHGLIRVDPHNSLTSLTLRGLGQPLPGSVVVVVEVEGDPTLCKSDQIGEICVASDSTASSYWGLKGLTNSNFKVQPLDRSGLSISDKIFVRTGLLGFVSPLGSVFVNGCREGLMTVSKRRHNVDDLIATVLAVQPMKFIYRGRLAIFSVKVLRDERIVIIAEQRPDCSEEDSFNWMSRVLQAIDSIHRVGVYCLALTAPNQIPKTSLGGILISEVKRKYLEGCLHPVNILMCPHACVLNLPKPRERPPEVSPGSQYVGNMVKGERFATAQGLKKSSYLDKDENIKGNKSITHSLKWRASNSPETVAFNLLSSKAALSTSLTFSQLHKKAEKLACFLSEKSGIMVGDHVALLYIPGLDFVSSFYGCLYINMVPVPIRPFNAGNVASTLTTIRLIVEISKAKLILTSSYLHKLIKSKEANSIIDYKSWPPIVETDDLPKKKQNWTSESFLNQNYNRVSKNNPKIEPIPNGDTEDSIGNRISNKTDTAYLDFSVSTNGTLIGVKISHVALVNLCKSLKVACELYPSRLISLCLDPYSGLGLHLWCFDSVYSGHQTMLIAPAELDMHPFLWLSAISQYKIRDTFCSYSVIDACTKYFADESNMLKLKNNNVDLSCLRNCVVVAEERPRMESTQSFSRLFSVLGLSPRCLSTSFGCRTNVALCLQGASDPSSSTVYVDIRSLRNDRLVLVEKGSPYSLSLIESGQLLPGVNVVVANPQTRCLCADSHLGEIWVKSPHDSTSYYAIYGFKTSHLTSREISENLSKANNGDKFRDDSPQQMASIKPHTQNVTITNEDFNVHLAVGDIKTRFAKTGYLGFLRRTELRQSDGEYHDALFVVGSMEETLIIRGMRFHPIDIEQTIIKSHKKAGQCGIFTWPSNPDLLVVVIELRHAFSPTNSNTSSTNYALDLVPAATTALLERHRLVTGVIAIVDPNVIPLDAQGRKRRLQLREAFLADRLDPIYVAYNM
ncbi:disco-interacting protein 2 homolog C-like [Gordionus sp. m RMFG-2023]|uniref:disco-interacting protein 2 homolog C-like n=1 Tax=Gordionus sp. m RMFG-2023 TaxID=3053472 RepID=UPI0031FDF90A